MTAVTARGRLQSPLFRKVFRYSLASIVATLVGEALIVLFVGVFNMGEVIASMSATCIAAIPNYEMNRKWAWGRTGRSHLTKEVLPFWGLALLGLAASTLSVWSMGHYARSLHLAADVRRWTVLGVYLAAFGVVAVGKFAVFNTWMFVHHERSGE